MEEVEKLYLGQDEKNYIDDYDEMYRNYVEEMESDRLLYDEETLEMLGKFQSLAEKLRRRGVPLKRLQQEIEYMGILFPKLVITEGYRMLLDDGEIHEIVLDMHTKALYFLYLRYPDGLIRKELEDHIDELIHIYKVLAGKQEIAPSKVSALKKMAAQEDNSFNVSCNRIKKEFLKYLEEDVAYFFYINGEQGAAKRIVMPRMWLTVK